MRMGFWMIFYDNIAIMVFLLSDLIQYLLSLYNDLFLRPLLNEVKNRFLGLFDHSAIEKIFHYS